MQCCPLSTSDDGCVEAYQCSHPTARKDTKCYECNAPISAGTKYEYVKGIWEGEWMIHKTCMSCKEIRDHFACNGQYVFGMLWEDLRENFFPTMKAGGPCMEGLSPEAKARLFDVRMKWLEERHD